MNIMTKQSLTSSNQAPLTYDELLLLAASHQLHTDKIKSLLDKGVNARFERSEPLRNCLGLGALECTQLLLNHSDVELVAEDFLNDNIPFDPDFNFWVFDAFGLSLKKETQEKWLEKYGQENLPRTLSNFSLKNKMDLDEKLDFAQQNQKPKKRF